jgi:hypothetical protein
VALPNRDAEHTDFDHDLLLLGSEHTLTNMKV